LIKKASDLLIILIGAALVAAGFNLMLIPHQLLSGGISGIAMLIGYFANLDISMLYLILNLPVILWGLFVLGKRFIYLSVVSIAFTVLFMQFIPQVTVTKDPILGAVFGGVIVAIGTGISLRIGGSTGGFDIVGSIITRKSDFPLGTLLFGLNGIVIFALGYFKKDWDTALASMLSMYISGKVVDTIHIRHIKVTLLIVTKEKDKLLEKMLKIPRGVTLIKAEGAYSHKEQDVLMTVTTRYELPELRKIIVETDPKAFVNIVETVGVLGEFRRSK